MGVGIGALMIFGPEQAYSSGSFAVAFDLLDRERGGVVWFVAGVAAWAGHWTSHATFGYGILLAVIVSWTLCLWGAVLTAESEAYSGPLVWGALTAMLTNSIVRYGSGIRLLR